MEPEQQNEWGMLRERAVEHLRDMRHIRLSKYRAVAQFMVLPSFTDTKCIDLLECEDDYYAFHTLWKSSKDIEAFRTPVERLKYPQIFIPTYESVKLEFDTKDLRNLLSALGSVLLSLMPTTNTVCLDGTSYELNVGPGYTGVRLRWQHELPTEWKELRPICDLLSEFAISR